MIRLPLLASIFLPLALVLPVAPQTAPPRTVPLEGVISKDIRYDRAAYDRLVKLRGGITPTIFELGHAWLRGGEWQGFSHAERILDQYVSYGAKHIVLTWSPKDAAPLSPDKQLQTRQIWTGMYDEVTQAYAAALNTWQAKHPGVTIYLRFGHEMDGHWYAYSDNANGNSPGDFVRAWRFVMHRFREEAPKVKLMWSALSTAPDIWTMDRWKQHFPCDEWIRLADGTPQCRRPIFVDMVCVTVYLNHSGWPVRTPLHEISLASHRLSQLAPGLPKCLSEFGIWETNDPKQKASQWRDVLSNVLPTQPFKFVLVYHWNSDERDAKHLESSPAALTAYRDGIRILRKGR